MFRCVALPAPASGKLLLHSMPGRYEVIDRVWRQLADDQVDVIVCLAEPEEIREESAEYAGALASGAVPCPVLCFDVPDRGVPSKREKFWELARHVARRLNNGETVLVHCAGGVGRTGMFAICVLVALGQQPAAARHTVSRAGSTVETAAQSELIAWCARRHGIQ